MRIVGAWGRASQVGNASNLDSRTSESITHTISLSTEWAMDLEKCIDASPLVCDIELQPGSRRMQLCVVGSHSGLVVAVDIETGSRVWTQRLPDRIESSACLWTSADKLAVPLVIVGKSIMAVTGCYDGVVYGLSLDDGSVTKTFATGDQIKSSPALDSQSRYVLVGSHDRHVYAVDFTPDVARAAWQVDMAAAVFASPAVGGSGGDRFVVACTLGGVMARIGMDGTVAWRRTLSPDGKPIFSSPAIEPSTGTIVVGCTDGRVYCVSSSDGSVWTHDMDGPVFSSPCLVASSMRTLVCIGSHGNRLAILDASDGHALHTETSDSPVYASPSACTLPSGRGVLVAAATTGGRLMALHCLDDGRIKACQQATLGGHLFSSPVFVDSSRLLQGSRSNILSCIRLR
ncbi:quinon protein alcohol dehydrogenase-like superfamily [Entophlyctis helioformis]|nr:quinon protein alcohol dehydrogenase-like superfamily [Entophlyctis helioformis]